MLRKAWIVVANANTARIYTVSKADKRMRLYKELPAETITQIGMKKNKVKRSPTLSIDKSGRAKEKKTQDFAQKIATILQQGLHDHDYDMLMLASSPNFYDALSFYLNEEITKTLTHIRQRDYTKATPLELERTFSPCYKSALANPH